MYQNWNIFAIKMIVACLFLGIFLYFAKMILNLQHLNFFIKSSHQKKRPNNIIFGRVYNETLLDMFELGISNF